MTVSGSLAAVIQRQDVIAAGVGEPCSDGTLCDDGFGCWPASASLLNLSAVVAYLQTLDADLAAAIAKAGQVVSLDGFAKLLASVAATASASAAIQKSDRTRVANLQAAIAALRSAVSSLDATIHVATSLDASLNTTIAVEATVQAALRAVILRVRTASLGMSAYITAAGAGALTVSLLTTIQQAREVSLDAQALIIAIGTIQTALGATIEKTQASQAELATAVAKLARTKTALMLAHMQGGQEAVAVVMARIMQPRTLAVSGCSVVKQADAVASVSARSVIASTAVDDAVLYAAILAHRTLTASTRAAIEKTGRVVSAATFAALGEVRALTLDLGAFIISALGVHAAMAAVVQATGLVSVDLRCQIGDVSFPPQRSVTIARPNTSVSVRR